MRGMQYAELEAFVTVAERRSFARAATLLQVSRPTLSENVRALEERLGVRLLNRTTRSVALTEAGQRLLERVKPALRELDQASAAAQQLGGVVAGPLKIVAQPVASFLIAPLLKRFLAANPAIQLDLSVSKIPPDLLREGYDAGIRLGEQVERDFVAVRVSGEAQYLTVAAPSYLERRPVPRTPHDLRDHDCIRARLPNGAIFGWEFRKKRSALHVPVDGPLVVDDIDLVIRAALDGIGIAYILRDFIEEPLARGRLIPVLTNWTPRLSGFFLYHPSRRQVTPALRAFIDVLVEQAKAKGHLTGSLRRGESLQSRHRLVRSRRGRRKAQAADRSR